VKDNVNDAFSPSGQMMGQKDIPYDDGQEDGSERSEDDESVEPNGGATFDSQGLADRRKGRLTNMLLFEDTQPFSRTRLLFWSKSHLIKLPLIMFDDSIHPDGEIRNKHVFFQLEAARR
jgi:hypothetical protein